MEKNILKDGMGYMLVIETARNPTHPKIATINTMVNRGMMTIVLGFGNNGHFPGANCYNLGGRLCKMWLQATLQGVHLGNDLP